FKAMINTVEFNPGMFQIMNRGITYICSNADYDEQTGKLVVTIPDSSELRRQSDGNVLRYGIADGGHTFEIIQNTIRDIKDNEDKEWHVIEVIQRAACFIKHRWVGIQPINMYKSKGKALKSFTNEQSRGDFKLLEDVLVDAITLPEYIQSRFSRGDIVPAKSLVKLKCVKTLKKTYTRPGTEYPTDHEIDMAALLPMAAGFRELLFRIGENEPYEWRVDP